jgi:hypothetical protein
MVPTGALYPWPASPLDLSSLCADAHKDLDPHSPPRGNMEVGIPGLKSTWWRARKSHRQKTEEEKQNREKLKIEKKS